MSLLIISICVLAWIAVGIVAAGLCWAARRGDATLESELESAAGRPRWVLEGDSQRLIALR